MHFTLHQSNTKPADVHFVDYHPCKGRLSGLACYFGGMVNLIVKLQT